MHVQIAAVRRHDIPLAKTYDVFIEAHRGHRLSLLHGSEDAISLLCLTCDTLHEPPQDLREGGRLVVLVTWQDLALGAERTGKRRLEIP